MIKTVMFFLYCKVKNKLLGSYRRILRTFIKRCLVTVYFTQGKNPRNLEVNFFTMVLNGMPFIKYHIEVLKKLNCPWKWHIVEGVIDIKYDGAWRLKLGGKIPEQMHKNGLSKDETSDYIDALAKKYPKNIYVYRKPKGQFWDGEREACNIVFQNIQKESLLWEIDVDEFWTVKQIETMIQMFAKHPKKTAAWFYCHFFVGPHLVVTSRDSYSNNIDYEWFRVWRYKPGMVWAAHEPPTLMLRTFLGSYDVGRLNPFIHKETEENGLIFDHYAYVLPKQLSFKENYYGYTGALKQWKRLQEENKFPVYLRDFFSWVNNSATVGISKPNVLDANILEEWKEFDKIMNKNMETAI